MATLVPVTVTIRVQSPRVFSAEVWTHGQASLARSWQSPRVQDETFSVWGPRCDESRFDEHFHGGGNHQHVGHATTSSCSLVWKDRCQVVSLSRLGQTRCRGHDVQDVREALEPCATREASRFQCHGTGFATTQSAVYTVAMKVTNSA